MSDAPLAPFGAPRYLRDQSTGCFITRPAFYPQSDPRPSKKPANHIKGWTLVHYFGLDETRDGIHVAATLVARFATHRIVHLAPDGFVRWYLASALP
jgi:hypothetical protein